MTVVRPPVQVASSGPHRRDPPGALRRDRGMGQEPEHGGRGSSVQRDHHPSRRARPLDPIAPDRRALHVDQLQARVQLGLQPSGVAGIDLHPPFRRPVDDSRRAPSVRAKVDLRGPAHPGARPWDRPGPVPRVAQLDVEAAGLALDFPERARRILGGQRPAADATLAGGDPSPGEVQLQDGGLVAGKAERESAPWEWGRA